MSSGAQQQVHPWGPNGDRSRAAFEAVPSSPHHHHHFIVNDNHEIEIIVNTDKDIAQSEGAPRKTTLDRHSDLPSTTNSGVDEKFDPNHGCYFRDNRRRIDFILVYKEHHDANEHENDVHNRTRRKFYLSNLVNTGVNVETAKMKEDNKIIHFVKIHVPFELALKTAVHLKMEMPTKLRYKPKKYRVGYALNRFFNCYYCTKTAQEDYSVIYYPFNNDDECLFNVGDHEKFFSHSQRHEIAWDVLQGVRNNRKDEKMRGVEGLVEHEIFETVYPIHDSYADNNFNKSAQKSDTTRKELKDTWANWRNAFKLQPLHEIRNYFGEHIAFYFAFMDFYTKQLGIPTVAGIIAFVIGMTLSWRDPEVEAACNEHEAPGSYIMCPICKPPACEPWEMYKEGCNKYRWKFALDNEATVTLSCVVIFWAIMFFKLWKRHEALLASEWNVFHIKTHNAGMRPEFEKTARTTRSNPITQETEPHVPYSYRILWLLISIGATFLLLCFTGVCLAGLVVSRIALYGAFHNAGGKLAHNNIECSRWFVHFLIFVLVTLTEKIYFKIGTKLTNFECPRTHHEYVSSLLWKMFVFELINEFIPLGYAAWIKGCTCHQGPPGPPGPPGGAGGDGKDGQNGKDGNPGKDGSAGKPPGPPADQCMTCPPGPPGPAGPMGPKGPPGPKGAPGGAGTPGKRGERGMVGPEGPPGRPGNPGQKGPKGDDGKLIPIDGASGPAGPPGTKGPKGPVGPPGGDGKPGPKGPPGDAGDAGDPGPDGKPGTPGPPGAKGPAGPPGSCDHCPPPRTAPGY